MDRRATSLLSLAPLLFVIVAAAIVLTSRPPSVPADPVGEQWTSFPELTIPSLPETRGPVAVEAPGEPTYALDVAGLRVVVPRLGIDLGLEIGDPERDVPRPGFAGATPEHVALVYPVSRSPGDGGNTYIYAHARNGMFLALWNAKIGDSVIIAAEDGTVRRAYRIGLIVPRVAATDTHWLEPDGVERVTLQTSTGPRADDPRFIVVAYPIAQSPSEPHLP